MIYLKNFLLVFISGLRDDIQPSVRMFKPKDLLTAIELARLQEEQLCASIKTPQSKFPTQQPHQQFRPSPYQQFRPHSPRPWIPQNHSSSNSVPNKPQSSLLGPHPKSTPPFQRVSANEMKERREKGLVTTVMKNIRSDIHVKIHEFFS